MFPSSCSPSVCQNIYIFQLFFLILKCSVMENENTLIVKDFSLLSTESSDHTMEQKLLLPIQTR
jgi:hypothetical protein